MLSPLSIQTSAKGISKIMITLIKTQKFSAILLAIGFPLLVSLTLAQAEKEAAAASPGPNQIVIKDFNFSPMTLTVKSGEKITWINRDEEPHTVVSVEKQFKKSSALDTDEEFTITAGAPGTYTYFCSVHPKMTGTIIVEKS
jgi:plastocyanin